VQNKRESATREGFGQRPDERHFRIDLLASDQRPHLYKPAAAAGQWFDRSHRCTDPPGTAEELRLVEKHLKYALKTARRQARAARRRARLGKQSWKEEGIEAKRGRG